MEEDKKARSKKVILTTLTTIKIQQNFIHIASQQLKTSRSSWYYVRLLEHQQHCWFDHLVTT